MVDSHKLTVESAKGKTDMLRKSVLPDDLEVEGDGRCPVHDCKAQFRFESSRSNHIREFHGMDVRLLPIRDYFDKAIQCLICPPSNLKTWTRRSHFRRHLLSQVHSLSESQAETIVGDMPDEAPIGRQLPQDVTEAEAETGDILMDVQNLNLVSDVAGPSSNAGGLVFLDEFCRQCHCHLCPREQSV